MAKEILAGSVDQTIDIFVLSNALSTGGGLTGLTYATSGLTCYYRKGALGSATQLSLATLSTVGTAHTDGGFIEIDATNCPGLYRLDLSDTIVATAGLVKIYLHGAANMAPVIVELEVVAVNKYDGVRMGMTALPGFAADAAGGLPISDAGGLDMDAILADTADMQPKLGTITDLGSGATIGDNLVDINDGFSGISVGSSAISKVASSFTGTTVSVTSGTYTDTFTLDGTYHQLADVAGTMDIYYEFEITSVGVPVSVTIEGFVNGINDDLDVYAYNWGGTSWDQIGNIQGGAASIVTEYNFAMTVANVGTVSPNVGLVRIRFANTGLTTCNFSIDRLLVNYAIVNQSVGYANGNIWVDTSHSNTNTVPFIDGVADNPVSTWAAALSLSTQLGIESFHIANGSTITLTGNSDNFSLVGTNWTLVLNGQSIVDAYIEGASVTGVSTGAGFEFNHCSIGSLSAAATFEAGFFINCAIASDDTYPITLGSVGTYYFDACYSGVAGTDTPVIDFTTAGSCNLNIRHYSGGIKVLNMGAAGTDNMSLEGHGQLKIDVTCVAGVIALRGHFKVTDDTNGAVTISEDANFFSTVVTAGYAQGSGTGSNQIQLAATASSVDGAYDPSMIFIASGTGTGQCRNILQYLGSSRTATVDRDWKVNPDSTSCYRITADAGREHVNEGLAQAGTADTITLNALGSSDDDAYIGQLLFIRSGTGADQARYVTAYNGTTKIATVNRAFDVTPDSTSGYVMLPNYTEPELLTKVDDIQTDVTANGAAIAALNDLSAAEVNAEMVDVVATDTYGEPAQGKPPEANTIASKLSWLYKFLINRKTNDGAETNIYNYAASVVDHKQETSELAGTVTKDAVETGP